MNTVFFACCETCIQDSRTNVLSLINVVDEISAIAFPMLLPKLTVLAVFTRAADEPESGTVRLQADISGVTVLDLELAVEFQGKLKTRSIGEVQGILIPTMGQLHISLVKNDQEISGWDIPVLHVGAPHLDLFNAPTGPAAPAA
jgi:hypothetical protein